MRVVHILKDGRKVDSVAGHVIQNEQFYRIYNNIIKRIGERK